MEQKIKVLSELRDILGRPEMLIVGSMALYLNGFEVEINDIDLEILEPNEEQSRIIGALVHATPMEQRIKNYSDSKEPRFDFTFQGVKINVFIKKEFSHKRYTFYNYFRVAGVLSVVQYMKDYGRAKDYKNVLRLVKQLLVGL